MRGEPKICFKRMQGVGPKGKVTVQGDWGIWRPTVSCSCVTRRACLSSSTTGPVRGGYMWCGL